MSLTPPSNPALWKQLLTGGDALRVVDAACLIADRIRITTQAPTNGPELSDGHAGAALLFHAMDQAGLEGGWADARDASLDAAIKGLAEVPLGTDLFSGFPGIAWTLQRLRPAPPGEDGLDEIDQHLLSRLERTPWQGDYDLIVGLVGLGVYALERRQTPFGKALLDAVLARLEETSTLTEGRRTWLTPPALLPAWQRANFPEGHYNLGLAHGVPGVVGLLGLVLEADPLIDPASRMLDESVAWLDAVRWADQPFAFDAWLTQPIKPLDPRPVPSRVAWCYGDLGASAGLLLAGLRGQHPVAHSLGLEVARLVATRPVSESLVCEATLCHGACGNAHIFNRMYQATGEEVFRTAALAYADLIWNFQGESPADWVNQDGNAVPQGIVTGTAAIALTLLALATPVEPTWDRMFLVDLPVRQS